MSGGRPLAKHYYKIGPLAEAQRMTELELLKEMGVAWRTGEVYKDRGMPEATADAWAAHFGLAAPTVWPEMLDHAIEDLPESDQPHRLREWWRPAWEWAEREREGAA